MDLHLPYSNRKSLTVPYTKNGANEDAQYVLKELQVPYDAENANWIIANAKADKVVLNTRKIEQDLKWLHTKPERGLVYKIALSF